MFKNRESSKGEYYSRYIASWVNTCKELRMPVYFDNEFLRWLESEGLNDIETNQIRFLAINGKLELEQSAKRYLMNNLMP